MANRICLSRPILVVLISFVSLGQSYICPPDNCRSIAPCPTPECENGILMENVINCGCCSVCVKYLEENDLCNPLSSGIPDTICGPGLICNTWTVTCVPQITACAIEQRYYDELAMNSSARLVGIRRPECDTHGFYKPKQCIPGTVCFCVDIFGIRIFGTEVEESAGDMDCGCSRFYNDHEMEIKNSKGAIWRDEMEMFFPLGLRCLTNGNFDSYQCLPDGTCFCFIDGKIKSTIVPFDFKEALWCNDLDPKKSSEKYYRPCEVQRNYTKLLLKGYRKNEVQLVGIHLPPCDLDGNYAPVQCFEDRCFCVDKMGKRLGIYEAERYSDKALAMQCNCARDEDVLKVNGVVDVSCDEIGNYKSTQCRGSQCFCADQNGKQTSSTVHVTDQNALNCTSDFSYQTDNL